MFYTSHKEIEITYKPTCFTLKCKGRDLLEKLGKSVN